jgi:hypothetical protein
MPAQFSRTRGCVPEHPATLHEGQITIEHLRKDKSDISKFIRSFRRANFEAGGFAVSLDQPTKSGASRYNWVLSRQ